VKITEVLLPSPVEITLTFLSAVNRFSALSLLLCAHEGLLSVCEVSPERPLRFVPRQPGDRGHGVFLPKSSA